MAERRGLLKAERLCEVLETLMALLRDVYLRSYSVTRVKQVDVVRLLLAGENGALPYVEQGDTIPYVDVA